MFTRARKVLTVVSVVQKERAKRRAHVIRSRSYSDLMSTLEGSTAKKSNLK